MRAYQACSRAKVLTLSLFLGCASLLVTTDPARAASGRSSKAKAAKQPIAVGVITGPQGAKMRQTVLSVLKQSGSYEVTDAEDIKPTDSRKTLARNASALQVDAIVVGTVTRRGSLILTVYSGNGQKLGTTEIKGGTFPKLRTAVENELEITLADPLTRARGPGKAPVARAEPKPAPRAQPKPAPRAEPKPAAKRKLAPGEEEEPEAEPEELSGETGAADEEASVPEGEEEEVAGDSEGEEESSEEAASDAGDAHKPGLRPFELIAGFRGYNRKFNYTGSSDANLHSYSLDLGPALLASARFYPGALFRDDALSHIGLAGRYEFGIATTTRYPRMDGSVANLSTQAGEWQLGLRGRLPLGAHELGMFGLYGSHVFRLRGDEQPGNDPYALVPDVDYRFLRVGVDARVHLSKLVVGAHLAPRFLLSFTELDKDRVWFPGATGSGLDFGLMGGWRVLPWLSAAGGIDFVRYGFDFNAIPSDNRVVAGGATDTYISLWLGAMLHLDGSAAVKSSGASAETGSDSAAESDEPEPESEDVEEEESVEPEEE